MAKIATSVARLRRALLAASTAAVMVIAGGAHAGGLPGDLDAFAQGTIDNFKIPGMAVVIVKGDALVAAAGFGVRRLGESAPVDGRTLCGIASLTKAFTSMALVMLAEDKKLSLDDPVVKHLPGFRMYDPYLTRTMTVRDLLVHNSGLPLGSGDLMWNPPTSFTTEELVAGIGQLEPVAPFRSRYAYDNVLYVVAGQVVAAVAQKPWLAFVQERILDPLGMRSTTSDAAPLLAPGNVAAAHGLAQGGRLQPIQPWTTTNVLAAAGLDSNAEDLARWMRALLRSSREETAPAGRLTTAARMREIWSIWTPIRIGVQPPALKALEPQFLGYGLGFNVLDYRGRKILTHTGTLPGYHSRIVLVPSLDLGVAILTNQWTTTRGPQAFAYTVLDRYMQVAPTDWVGLLAAVQREDDAREAKVRSERRQPSTGGASQAIERIAGVYKDSWLGEARIAREGEGWVMRFARSPGLVGDVEPWGDAWVARWRDRSLNADALIRFLEEGGVARLEMKALYEDADFSFDFHHLKLVRTSAGN
jgi:CubicO group peptidase (beta-lactamase class C family)